MSDSLTGRAALFDMDGTLVDSTAVVEALWTEFAERHGLDPAEVLAVMHGVQTRDTVARFLPDADVDALTADYLAEELRRRDGIVEVPGAAAFVAAIREHVPVAVVTSAARSLAELRLGLAGIPDVDVVVTAEDVSRGKPDPAGYLLAAQRLGVDPAECLAFEDAEAGLLSARASGAVTVVVGGHDGPAADGLLRLADLQRAFVEGENGEVRVSTTG